MPTFRNTLWNRRSVPKRRHINSRRRELPKRKNTKYLFICVVVSFILTYYLFGRLWQKLYVDTMPLGTTQPQYFEFLAGDKNNIVDTLTCEAVVTRAIFRIIKCLWQYIFKNVCIIVRGNACAERGMSTFGHARRTRENRPAPIYTPSSLWRTACTVTVTNVTTVWDSWIIRSVYLIWTEMLSCTPIKCSDYTNNCKYL